MTSKNQSGITSVMFALVFSAVLTMIAIGFAFVVRNDQRQTLDRYLSYQAQYAAESGVNQAINNIRTAQATLGTVPSGDTCQTYDLSGDGTVKATCVTWSTEADYIYKESLGSEPFVSKIKPADPPPNDNYSAITLTWTNNSATSAWVYGWDAAKLPEIEDNHFPVLRVSIMRLNGASGYDNFKQIYIVPTDGGSGSSALSLTDGSLARALCNIANRECSITLTGASVAGFAPEAVLSVAALGEIADSLKINISNGSPRKLAEAQITIDSNAIAQDVTKRVQARIPFMADTWNPGFVAAAGEICKDIKIDGTNGTSISGGPVCPDTSTP